MTSPLPPRRRDSRNLADLIRQDRARMGQLDPGLVGGRFPPARPLKPEFDDGGEDDYEEPTILWEWSDRLVVTTAGQQTFRLSHEPIDESLTIRWHPEGKGGIVQTDEGFIVNGQTVTILDRGGDVQPGDVFSAQYQYEEGESSDSALTLVGTGQVYASNPALALPAGTQTGDFIVITTVTGTTSDPRVSLLADHNGTGLAHFYTYVGTVTSLGDFTCTGGMTLASWAVFHAPQVTLSPAAVVGPSSAAFALPSVAARHAIVVGGSRNGLVGSTMTLPAGYSTAVDNALLFGARGLIAYWDASADEASPGGSVSGDFDDYMVNVIGLTNENAD